MTIQRIQQAYAVLASALDTLPLATQHRALVTNALQALAGAVDAHITQTAAAATPADAAKPTPTPQ